MDCFDLFEIYIQKKLFIHMMELY